MSTSTTFLNYKLGKKLGEGGMGCVFLAQQTDLDREVALKILHPSCADLKSKEDSDRFLLEAQILSRLQHPNLIAFYTFGIEQEKPYFVMEYFPGQPISYEAHRLRSSGKLQAAIGQVCDGLSHAHDRGVIHRDVKPSNILVSRDDQVKIIDFGLAKSQMHQSLQLTRAGMTVGTPAYASPEQCVAGKLDARTDIYSLACVIYELLAGHPPFIGSSEIELMQLHCHAQPRPLVDHPAFDAVLQRALMKDPKDRQQNMQEFKAELFAAFDGEESPDSQVQSLSASSRKASRVRLLPAVGAVIVIISALVAYCVFTDDGTSTAIGALFSIDQLTGGSLSRSSDSLKIGSYLATHGRTSSARTAYLAHLDAISTSNPAEAARTDLVLARTFPIGSQESLDYAISARKIFTKLAQDAQQGGRPNQWIEYFEGVLAARDLLGTDFEERYAQRLNLAKFALKSGDINAAARLFDRLIWMVVETNVTKLPILLDQLVNDFEPVADSRNKELIQQSLKQIPDADLMNFATRNMEIAAARFFGEAKYMEAYLQIRPVLLLTSQRKGFENEARDSNDLAARCLGRLQQGDKARELAAKTEHDFGIVCMPVVIAFIAEHTRYAQSLEAAKPLLQQSADLFMAREPLDDKLVGTRIHIELLAENLAAATGVYLGVGRELDAKGEHEKARSVLLLALKHAKQLRNELFMKKFGYEVLEALAENAVLLGKPVEAEQYRREMAELRK